MMQNKNGMEPEDQRNFIIAMVLIFGLLMGHYYLFMKPANDAARAEFEKNQIEQAARDAANPAPLAATPDAPLPAAERFYTDVYEAIASSDRVTIDSDRILGSVRLQGGVLDDVKLKDHKQTVEGDDLIRLLRPANAPSGYSTGWFWRLNNRPLTSDRDVWTASSDRLTTASPVTLTLEKGGLRIERTVSVDDNYMLTFSDTVTNVSGAMVDINAIGLIRRYGDWKAYLEATEKGSSLKMGLAHQGLIASFDNELTWRNYKNLAAGKGIKQSETTGEFIGTRAADNAGWLGLTDMYWMAALVPEAGRGFRALAQQKEKFLEIATQSDTIQLGAGETITVDNRIFAGAKEYETVNAYQASGIPRFGDSIDWGNILYYITRPVYWLLHWLGGVIGSFGWAIIALTVILKIPFLPLFNSSYKSMAKMKKLAEPMKEIQERYKDDPTLRQQKVMELYKKEGANPLAGCLPLLPTFFVFFALYKVLYVTIEMRHAAFWWMSDLSAPDPLVLGNLFGLIPWATGPEIQAIPIMGYVLGLGLLPMMYAATMAATQSLSPPPPDPTQRRIMMFLPFIFMFVFAVFPAGLVIYWVSSNLFSLIQQYIIMRRQGVDTQLDKLIRRIFGGEAPEGS